MPLADNLLSMDVDPGKEVAGSRSRRASLRRAAIIGVGLLVLLGLVLVAVNMLGPGNTEAEDGTDPDAATNLAGGDQDKNGCIPSAGYLWCPKTAKCGRPWEQTCEGGYEGEAEKQAEGQQEERKFCAPNRRAFPGTWGEPPKKQTRDLVPLPGGYGSGSGTLAKWIQKHVDEDPERFAEQHTSPKGDVYPQSWGGPPKEDTAEEVAELPCDYGQGSSTLASWIQMHEDMDASCGALRCKRNS